MSSTLATTSSFTSRTRTRTPRGKSASFFQNPFNTDLTYRIAIGPLNFIKQESEQIIKPAADMIKLPPNHYCIIKNPIVRDSETGAIVRLTGCLSYM